MVWSFSAIVLFGITQLATCTTLHQSPEANPNEDPSLSENQLKFTSLLSTLNKRNGISRIDNVLNSFPPQNYPYRSVGGSLEDATTDERFSSQDLNLPGADRGYPEWYNPQYLYGDPTAISQNEGTDDSTSLTQKRRTKELLDKPSAWKRRLQMQGPGIMRTAAGQKGLLGYNGNRNKGLVLSIDLGIKALRDAIYHAKIRQHNRKLQAQAQRNVKLLHNIGKRRAAMEEYF